ncbi:cation:dicarboxylate symporter family transporter, partial [Enterococcus faecium]|uniref:cation:dicarboxylate symporter family transporter n=1 Tax=Enterococcus faecium TaxID=1352 RepID=UPI003F42B8F0
MKAEQMHMGETGYRAVEDFVTTAFRGIEVILGWVISFIPLAVFGVVARTIGRDGLQPLRVLAWYVGVALLGLAIQVFVIYQAWVVFGA